MIDFAGVAAEQRHRFISFAFVEASVHVHNSAAEIAHCRDTLVARRRTGGAVAAAADGRDVEEEVASFVECVGVETVVDAEAKASVANGSFHNNWNVALDRFAFASVALANVVEGDAVGAVEVERVDPVATDWYAYSNNVSVVRNWALQLKDLNLDLHHPLVVDLVLVLGFDCSNRPDFRLDDEAVRRFDLGAADVLVFLHVDFDRTPPHISRIAAAAAVRPNSVVVAAVVR